MGGTQVIVNDLSRFMCDNRHDVIVATGGDGFLWSMLDPRVEKVEIKNLGREIHPIKDCKALFELRNLYKKEGPDIIHLYSAKGIALGSIIFPRKRIIWSINGFDSLRIKYRKFLFFMRLLKNRCAAVNVESSYDKQNFAKEINSKRAIYVIRNSNSNPTLIPGLSISGTEKYSKVVMNIARISPQKRFESFVEIAKLLPEYAFVWIGADEDYEHPIPNLFVLKSEPNAKKYLQLADIFVLPTNYEGFPVAIVEALSYGKPVVASDVGAISEIVLNGENGYTLENDNRLFAEKIKYILENEDVYQRFSKKSLEIFERELLKDKAMAEYKKLYEKIYDSIN
jgi:glycosyltransferase involved in cell wall biosynthesis